MDSHDQTKLEISCAADTVANSLGCDGTDISRIISRAFTEFAEEIRSKVTKPEEPFLMLSIDELMFMDRFGWEFEDDKKAIKRDLQTGKVLAHEGDETWTWDLKVAGE